MVCFILAIEVQLLWPEVLLSVLEFRTLLGGSCVLMSRVISRVTIIIITYSSTYNYP